MSISGGGLGISTRSLVHIYHSEGHDVAALSGVDLSVGAGEMIGLLGPSGAGKSTLLSLLGGLFRPSAGKIFVGDVEFSEVSAQELDALRAREVALLLQGAARNLLPYLTAAGNVAFAQKAGRRLGAEGLRPVRDVLETVGALEHADAPLASLAPGHLQLVALAVAIATGPGLLLADEPTSQLDHRARDEVLTCLERVNRELGTTVVLVTHDPDVAQRMPRTVTIRDGKIGGEGRSGEEYAVVTVDGFLPLPAHVLADLPAGTLVRLHAEEGVYRLLVEPGDDRAERRHRR